MTVKYGEMVNLVNPKISIYKIDEINPGTMVCRQTAKNLPTSLNVNVLNPIQFTG